MSHGALLFALVMAQAPAAAEAAAKPASEAAPEAAAAPAEAPPSADEQAGEGPATAAPTEQPAPVVAPAPTPEGPAPASERPPAVGKTEVTAATAKKDAESEVGKASYKVGKGLTVATKDGRFSLQLRGRLQVRYDLEHYNTVGADAQPLQQSLHIRRARILLAGNVFSPYVKYRFQFGFSRNDMESGIPVEPDRVRRNPLRDARIEFDRLRDFNVTLGQFKVGFNRQRLVSSSNQNMVDRSAVNAEFTLDRDLGIQASSKDIGGLGGYLGYSAGVFMGEGRNTFELSDPGMLYVGRFEVLPLGKFDDYSEGDLGRSKKPGLAIAAAYAYQDRAHAARGTIGDYPADGGTTDFHHVTGDLMFKWRGLSFEAAFNLRKGFNRRSGGAVDDAGMPIATVPARQGLGWFGQLGYVVPKIPLEVVARYGLIRNIYGTSSSMRDSDEAGGGLNYYFVGHDLKLQLDYFRLWDASMGATPAEAARHGTDRVRVQVQVFF